MDAVLELEIGPTPEAGTYVVRVLRSDGGGEPFASVRLDVDALTARRSLLEASVLSSAVPARRVVPATEEAVREVGRTLFEATFQGEVGAAYRASAAVAAERDAQLQLVLRLTSAELAALPWEALFDPVDGTYLCRRDPLVRHVPSPHATAPLAIQPPLRILAMVASPRGMPQLDAEAERERLSQALGSQIDAGLVELAWLENASWAAVHARLLEGGWHVLHFIGHGDYDEAADEGVLAFVDADGRADLVPAHALADLLDEADPTPPLVVLNSCDSGAASPSDLFSGTAAALAHSGIRSVVAMQYSISDAAALAFARGFYTALAQGRPVDEAVRSGRIGILGTGRGTLEWVTPVLYLRGEEAHLFARPFAGSTTTAGTPAGPARDGSDAEPAGRTRTPPRWAVWTGIAAAAAVVIGAVLFAVRPWESGDDGSGGPVAVEGIGGTSRTVWQVDADADSVWTDVWCEEDDRLDITATGEARPDPAGTPFGPDGMAEDVQVEDRIVAGIPTGALIGQLEDTDDPVFAIGSGADYVCPVSGTLVLGLNDTTRADNTGAFEVTVTVVPAQ
ncbi:CHAT domain-containing protein [Agromyces sp. SYSU T0242]|uniref:CHAT domain-containing protein n=1 Tax=Agromyces litoreus TaxID=3158561 RepID=UPI003396D543